MNNRNPGEGLHILWEIIVKGLKYRFKLPKPIRFFLNRLSLPPACPEHGRSHLFAQRIDGKVAWKCMVSGCTWSSRKEPHSLNETFDCEPCCDNAFNQKMKQTKESVGCQECHAEKGTPHLRRCSKRRDDWQSKREDYLSGKH